MTADLWSIFILLDILAIVAVCWLIWCLFKWVAESITEKNRHKEAMQDKELKWQMENSEWRQRAYIAEQKVILWEQNAEEQKKIIARIEGILESMTTPQVVTAARKAESTPPKTKVKPPVETEWKGPSNWGGPT